MKTKSMNYAKIEKHSCISTYFAASTVGWLGLKPVLGRFKSIMKNVLPRIFFYGMIFTRTIQTSHEIANIMKHDQLRKSRKRANLCHDTNHARRSPVVGFLEAGSEMCTLSYIFKYPLIYRKQS